MVRERSARRDTGNKSPCEEVYGGTKRFNAFLAEGICFFSRKHLRLAIAQPLQSLIVRCDGGCGLKPRAWASKRAARADLIAVSKSGLTE
jgi:hypothetical protein